VIVKSSELKLRETSRFKNKRVAEMRRSFKSENTLRVLTCCSASFKPPNMAADFRPERFFADPRVIVDVGTMEVALSKSPSSFDSDSLSSGALASLSVAQAGSLEHDQLRFVAVANGLGTQEGGEGGKTENVTHQEKKEPARDLPEGLGCVEPWRLLCPIKGTLACCVSPELAPREGQSLRFSAEYARGEHRSDGISCAFGAVVARGDDGSGISCEKLYRGMLDDTTYSLSRAVNGWVARYGECGHRGTKIPENVPVEVCLDYSRGTSKGVFSVSFDAEKFELADGVPPGAIPFVYVTGVEVTVHSAELISSGAFVKSARKG
jgi:hypothetical protein